MKTFIELYNNFKAAHEERDDETHEVNLAKEEDYFHEVRAVCLCIETEYSQFKDLVQSYPEQVHKYEFVVANQKMVGDRDTNLMRNCGISGSTRSQHT